MAEKTTVLDKAKQKYNQLFGAKKPEAKDLGSGYAKEAAAASKTRNDKTKQVADALESGKEMPSYKKGGKIKKTGPALVHKGEHMLTTSQVKKPAVKNLLSDLAKGDDYKAEMKGVKNVGKKIKIKKARKP
jgi:hypothetical protein